MAKTLIHASVVLKVTHDYGTVEFRVRFPAEAPLPARGWVNMNDEELTRRLLDETDKAWTIAVGLRHNVISSELSHEAYSKMEWVRFLYSEYIFRNLKTLCTYDEWWIREVIDTLSDLLLRDKVS